MPLSGELALAALATDGVLAVLAVLAVVEQLTTQRMLFASLASSMLPVSSTADVTADTIADRAHRYDARRARWPRRRPRVQGGAARTCARKSLSAVGAEVARPLARGVARVPPPRSYGVGR